MENYCFVIQPISDDTFTKRYDDVYAPAIEKTGLKAYRVDLDASVKIPIQEIEQKIKDATLCFAEITKDNPNVWYELGYAFASEKDVVMVCEKSRGGKFPFDIQHKSIITYDTQSTSDFTKLSENITAKASAYLKEQKITKKIQKTPIQETDGLQSYELAIMAFIIGEQYTDEVEVSVWHLRDKIIKSGFNETAFTFGLRGLKTKGFISTNMGYDNFNNHDFPVCKLTESGFAFAQKNLHLFDLAQQTEQSAVSQHDEFQANNLPF